MERGDGLLHTMFLAHLACDFFGRRRGARLETECDGGSEIVTIQGLVWNGIWSSSRAGYHLAPEWLVL